jgi:hypothetical protein
MPRPEFNLSHLFTSSPPLSDFPLASVHKPSYDPADCPPIQGHENTSSRSGCRLKRR